MACARERSSGRRVSGIGGRLLPEHRRTVDTNLAQLLVPLKAAAAGNLVGVDRAIGSEGEIGKPEVRAPSLAERVRRDSPVALELEESRARLAVDEPVGGTFENRRVATTAPGVRRGDLGGNSVGRDLPDS